MQRPIKGIYPDGDPSPDIHQLRENIVAFLEAHPVGSENMGPPPTTQPACAKLVRSTTWNGVPPSVYNVQWADPTNNTAAAYFLSYRSINLQGSNVPYIDIPADPQATLVFTGELIGCSLVVIRREDGVRVYHDSRYCSSVLYDDVLMAVDFCDYCEERGDATRRKIDPATTCMQFKDGSWALYAQLLGENTQNDAGIGAGEVPESKRYLRYRNDKPLITRTSYTRPNLEQDREDLYLYLKAAAVKHLGADSIPTTQDGPFEAFTTNTPSMSNPAVARTEALRQVIVNRDLEGVMRSKVKEKKEQYDNRRTRPQHEHAELYTQHQNEDLDFRTFIKALSDSKSTDATFLWLQLKAAQGLQAVVAEA